MLFKLQTIGNLTRDAELKAGSQGDYLQFDIAVNLTKTKVQYVQCSINNVKLIEAIQQYLTKGQQVWLDGQPAAGSYTNKEGKVVNTFSLYVNQIELLGGKSSSQEQTKQAASFSAPKNTLGIESDIPF